MVTKSMAIDLAKKAAFVADEKMGEDIVAFDVRDLNAIADVYMFIGATSHIHVRALEDAIREALKAEHAQLIRTDGQRGHLWRVLDYGSLLVHVIEKKTREFYAVERLWEEGKKIPLLKRPAPIKKKMPSVKKKPTKKKLKK